MSNTLNCVDTYINGLNYDSRNILVDNSSVPEYKKEDGKLEEDGTFLVIKKKQCSVANNTSELTYVDSLASRLFPGAMVLCNSNLIENNPLTVTLKTKPTKFSIDLPNMDTGIKVNTLTKYELDAAIKAKIAEWKQNNPNGNIAAKVKHSLYEVKSQHQLSAALGLNIASSKLNFNIDFNAIENSESRDWILKFEQIYYNVTLNNFQKPSDIIDDSVSEDELRGLGINDKNPLGIVNNVNYGRIIYVHFKTNNKSIDLNGKLHAILTAPTNLDFNAQVDYKDIKDNFSLDVFIYGGGSSAFSAVPQISIDTIHEFIEQGYNFDAQQEAAPIGYSVAFMKNGAQELATVNSTSTYIETTIERFDKAHLRIEQKAAFVNCFNITWNEISYDQAGNAVITAKSWEHNNQNCCVGEQYDLFFNGNVRNLHIVSKGYTGIIWNKIRTNFDRTVSLAPEMKLTVRGTTLNQKCELT